MTITIIIRGCPIPFFLPFLLISSLSPCLLHAFILPSSPTSITAHQRHHRHSTKAFASEMLFMRKLFINFENGHGIGSGAVGYVPNVAAKKCNGMAKNDKGKGPLAGWGLQFALNKLAPAEQYLRAELHLRGRLESLYDTGTLSIVQYICSSETEEPNWPKRKQTLQLARLQDERVHTPAGWTAYDALTPLMYTSMDEQAELFINFLQNGKLLGEQQLKHFFRIHRPFLVVYTDNNPSASSKAPMIREKREARAIFTNYVHDEEKMRQHMDSVGKAAEFYSYGMAKGNGDGMSLNRSKARGEEKTLRMMLGRRRKQKQKDRKSHRIRQSYPGFDPNDPMLGFGTPYSPWQRNKRLLQSPNSGNSLNDISALREHAYRIGKGKDSRDEENGQDGETKLVLLGKEGDGNGRAAKSEKCSLHNMTVDFRHLGWSDRIIAPKMFEAGFCAGQCQHPLEQDSNPSNHAILQALMAVQQQQKQQVDSQQVPVVPSVCCAPDSFDSLTLLYFDEHDNVVLKSYPRMVVVSCGCL